MLSVCVSELLTLTTPPLCGEMQATQSFLRFAISISFLALAEDSLTEDPPEGPLIKKLMLYSA